MDTSRAVVLRGVLENFHKKRATGDFLLSDLERSAAGLTAVASALASSGGGQSDWHLWRAQKKRLTRFNSKSTESRSPAG